MSKTLFSTLLLALGCAQASTGVTIDKPKVLFNLSAGQSVTGVVNVLNPSLQGNDLEVKVEQNDWLLAPNGDPRYLSPGSQPKSLAKWLSLPANLFSLAGGGQRDVRYTIQIPPGTPDGLYWGVLFFNGQNRAATTPATKPQTARLNYNVVVGHMIYVMVGTSTSEGRIVGMKSQLESGKVTVSTTLRNTGNTFLNVGGKMELRDQKGNKVSEVQIAPSLVLPGYNRSYDITFDKALAPGQYLALTALEYQPGKFYTGEVQFTVK